MCKNTLWCGFGEATLLYLLRHSTRLDSHSFCRRLVFGRKPRGLTLEQAQAAGETVETGRNLEQKQVEEREDDGHRLDGQRKEALGKDWDG